MRTLSETEIQAVSGAQGVSLVDHVANAGFTLGCCGTIAVIGATSSPLWAAGSVSAVAPHILLSSTAKFTFTSAYLFSLLTVSSYLDVLLP